MATKVPKEQKGAFYTRELEGARLRGEWEGDVNLSGGTRLAWSELLRKHMKHNPNDQALPSVANAEQTIRSNLAAWYRQEGFTDASYQEDSADLDGSGKTTFPVPLPQDQAGQGWSSQSVSEAVQQLSNFRGVGQNNMSKHTIAAIEAYALFAQGQDEATVELLHEVRFLEDVDLEGLKTGKFNEDYTLALIMMGYTVYGLANERLFVKRGDKGYIPFAYAGYACTIDLHESVRGGKSANALRGLLADEIENWGEISLYRNALLSVRHGNTMMALNSLRAYQAHSGRWPANFRETQRLIILHTYLRLLNQSRERGGYTPPPSNVSASKDDCRSAAYQTSVVAASASRTVVRDFEGERTSRYVGNQSSMSPVLSNGMGSVSSRTTSTRRPAPYRSVMSQGPTLWSNELHTVQKAASDTITRSSYFPKAGQVNIPALNLSDEVIRGWQLNGERGGDWADEVVDLLYLLSRVTFHSQRISRHLFTLLVASENYEESKKALELYIQIVEKAREGDAAEAGGLVEESRRQEEGHEGPANGNGALTAESKKEAEKIHLDSDSDAIYIDTLLYGVHVIAKYLNDAREADKLAKKIFAFIESDAEKTMSKDMILYAKVKRVAGIARAAFCAAENDASTRATLQDEALSLLKQSLTLDDQSSEAYYALAYLQSEMLDVGNAIRSARKAVELEPANVDNWHLLTLLLSSQKDYRGALKIAELGLGEAEDDDEVDAKGSDGTNGMMNGNSGKASRRVLLLSMDYPPRGAERAESILRLMITHNALEEIIEGGQAAIEGQREIFEFFHRRIGASWQAQGPRHKLGGGPGGAMNGGDGPAAIPPRIASKGVPQSTVLGGSQHQHNRFHSLTGLGQSGSSHQLLPTHSSTQSALQTQDYSNTRGGHVGIPVLSQDEGEQEVGQVITNAQIRAKYHNSQQMHLLASLWLMAAATFRRNGKLTECRTAIQEAERVDPGEAEVWFQLALWFEQQPGHHDEQQRQPHNLAIQSLYKALACKGDHVGATVHLARLFLLNPSRPSIREVQEAIADVASPLPQTSDNIHPTPLASDLLSHTQSRRITASGTNGDSSAAKEEDSRNTSPQDVEEAIKKETEATQERKRLATVSLAEGLLVNTTQTNGWNVPEAWLFLGKVMKETNRWERQRECLEYALQLEKAKSIRSLSLALPRS